MRGGGKTKASPRRGTGDGSRLAAALLLSLAVLAVGSSLTAQNPGSAAGTITALIPKDYIQRGRSSFEAQKGADVLWLDTVRTEQGGRVRVTLTDGSILNVGSSSQLKIVRHNAASEQSELELIYGKVRADVVKRTRPDGEFKVRTQQAVAGVVGTGEYLNATPTETTVLAVNGAVAVTSNNPTIAGTVILFPGEITSVQTNRPPAPKRKATDEEIEEASSETATLPRVTIDPSSAGAGTAIAAEIRGEGLAGATAVTFSQAGLTAALGESTAESLAITLTVADNVPVGSYSFVVSLADGSEAEGRLTVQPPQATGGGGLQGLLDVHLPPDAVITGDWYYDRQQPPEPVTTGQLSVVQGALLQLNATESRSAEGHPIRQFEWEIENTLLRGAGPNFEIDTWRLERGSYSVWLRVTDDDGHSARTELRLGVEPVPDPALLIADCIVAGNEARDINLFMGCFSPELFRGYPILEESTRNFFQTAAEVRVYYRIDNQQVQRDLANFQVTLELSFTTEDNPTVVQPRRESLTLRMLLVRSRSSAEWKIIDFSSRGAATGADTGSETLTPDFTLTMGINPAVGVTVRTGGEPTIISISVEPLGSFANLVQFSVRNLPPGVEARFDPSGVPAGNSATLTLSAPRGTPAGIAIATIVGRSGGLERTANLRVEVQAAAQPAINVSPTSLSFGSVLVGTTSAGQTVTVTNSGSADLSVSSITLSGSSAFVLSLPGLPATLAPGGTLTFDLTFSPAAVGLVSGTVTIASDAGSPTVSLTGTGAPAPNSVPNAVDDSASTNEDTPVSISVLANDSDPDGDSLTITAVGTATNGSAIVSGSQISYTPNLNFNGADSFTYTISDGQGGSDTASVNVTVNPVNDAPVANDDSYSTNENTALNVPAPGVLANDTDIDSSLLIPVPIGGPTSGTLFLAPNGSFTYTPAAGFSGTASFTYRVNDGSAFSNTATVTISVGAVNDAPLAVDDSVVTDEDTPVLINVLSNDTDPDGDSLTITAVSAATNGSVSFTASNITYTPNANFFGADSFTYRASDGSALSNVATVSISIGAVNDLPNAVDDVAALDEDTSALINVLANDSDADGDTLSITAVGPAANGAVSFTGASVTYTPNANFNGSDSFSYTLSDGNGGSDSATVTVTVNAVNDAPVAINDSYSTAEDTLLAILAASGVLANDSDVDGDSLTAVLVSGPANGSLTLNPDGSFSYTPNAGFNGADGFTYQASDGSAFSNTATVLISVSAVNDAPNAVDDVVSLDEDASALINVLTNDSDPDGDSLTITAVSAATNGSVSFTASNITYTPNANFFGADSFTYTVSDGNGGTDSATVTVTVNAVNDAPVAVNDSYSTAEDTLLAILAASGVLANDSDVDGDSLTAVLVSGPANGSLTFNPDGSFTYTPAAGFNGSDSFTYQASDGSTLSNVATVNLSVGAVNDVPVVNAGPDQTADEGATVSLAPATFTDPDAGDTHTATINWGDGTTTAGTVSAGTVSGSHAYADNGPYTVTVTVTDSAAGADSDTLLVTVNNVAPTVSAGPDQSATVGSAVSLAPATFTDPGTADTHTASIDWGDGTVAAGSVSAGTVAGSHTYSSIGSVTVTVTVTDDDGVSGSDSLLVTVAGQAQISVSPNPMNFGIVQVGSSETTVIVVSNPGSATLSLTSIPQPTSSDCPGTFSHSAPAPPLNIPAGGNTSFNVGFAPTTNTSCTGTLEIFSNASGSATLVSLSGQGSNQSPSVAVIVQNADGTTNSSDNPLNVSASGPTAAAVTVGVQLTGFSGRIDLDFSNPTIPASLVITTASGADVTGTSPDATLFFNQGQNTLTALFNVATTAQATPGLVGVQILAFRGNTLEATVTLYIDIVASGSSPMLALGPQRTQKKKAAAPSGTATDQPPPGQRRRGRRGPAPEEPLALADLVVSAEQVALEPARPRAGERARLQVAVRNRGEVEAEEFTLALAIPAWQVQAEQRLSLGARQGALVEFDFAVPVGAVSARRVAARLVADPENRLAESDEGNNYAQVSNLVPRAAATPSARSVAEFALGECVSFNLATADTSDCGTPGDFQLSGDGSRLTLAADGVRDLGFGWLRESAESVAEPVLPQAAVQVGHVYEIANGAQRAQVRVVQVQQIAALQAAPHGLPDSLDTPRVNDPFRLPGKKRPAGPVTISVRVELEWVVLP